MYRDELMSLQELIVTSALVFGCLIVVVFVAALFLSHRRGK